MSYLEYKEELKAKLTPFGLTLEYGEETAVGAVFKFIGNLLKAHNPILYGGQNKNNAKATYVAVAPDDSSSNGYSHVSVDGKTISVLDTNTKDYVYFDLLMDRVRDLVSVTLEIPKDKVAGKLKFNSSYNEFPNRYDADAQIGSYTLVVLVLPDRNYTNKPNSKFGAKVSFGAENISKADISDTTNTYCVLTKDVDPSIAVESIAHNLCKPGGLFLEMFKYYVDETAFMDASVPMSPKEFIEEYVGVDKIREIVGSDHNNHSGFSNLFGYHCFTNRLDNHFGENSLIACYPKVLNGIIILPKEFRAQYAKIAELKKLNGLMTVEDYIDRCEKSKVPNTGSISTNTSNGAKFVADRYSDMLTIFKADVEPDPYDNQNTVVTVGNKVTGAEYDDALKIIKSDTVVESLDESLLYLNSDGLDLDKYEPVLESVKDFWEEIKSSGKRDKFNYYVVLRGGCNSADDVDALLLSYENSIRSYLDMPYKINIGIEEVINNDTK